MHRRGRAVRTDAILRRPRRVTRMQRRACLSMVLALAVVACDRAAGLLPPAPSVSTVPPAPAKRPGPSEAQVRTAPPHSILMDLGRWDAASTELRRAAAEEVERRASGFKLLRLETFACAGVRHEVAIYLHDRTGMEFVLVPGGTFLMGSPEEERFRRSSETPHKVTLTQPFLMARTETTCGTWRRVMGAEPPKAAGALRPAFKGDEWPMVSIIWDEAAEFCNAAGLALPSEEQWEYACRAGVDADFCCGDDEDELDRYAWIGDNAGHKLHAVAGKKPNAFGLFDVHGNTAEFCDGWWVYGPSGAPVIDPVPAPLGASRMLRGGTCESFASDTRAARRDDLVRPDRYSAHWGFRAIARLVGE